MDPPPDSEDPPPSCAGRGALLRRLGLSGCGLGKPTLVPLSRALSHSQLLLLLPADRRAERGSLVAGAVAERDEACGGSVRSWGASEPLLR